MFFQSHLLRTQRLLNTHPFLFEMLLFPKRAKSAEHILQTRFFYSFHVRPLGLGHA